MFSLKHSHALTNKIPACFPNKVFKWRNNENHEKKKKSKPQCNSLDCIIVTIIFASLKEKRKQMIQTDSKTQENKGLQTTLNHASVRHALQKMQSLSKLAIFISQSAAVDRALNRIVTSILSPRPCRFLLSSYSQQPSPLTPPKQIQLSLSLFPLFPGLIMPRPSTTRHNNGVCV